MTANNFSVKRELEIPVLDELEKKVISPSSSQDNSLSNFIIISPKPLDKDSLEKLNHLGKTVVWSEKFFNHTPIDQIKFDYMIITLNENSRDWILDNVVSNQNYHTVAISDVYEKWINQIKAESTIKRLPTTQIKAQFDRNLLVNHVSLPSNKYKLFLKKFVQFFLELCSSQFNTDVTNPSQ